VTLGNDVVGYQPWRVKMEGARSSETSVSNPITYTASQLRRLRLESSQVSEI